MRLELNKLGNIAKIMPLVPSRPTSKPSSPASRRGSGLKTYLDATVTNNRFLTSFSSTKLKRWDGTKRICTNWDTSQEDSELSTRNGNCLIYLHSYRHDKGQDTRLVASFKLPFPLLLANKCYALIERFFVIRSTNITSVPRRSPSDIQKWYRSDPRRRVELFIPPPQNANERQLERHRVLTRNFFAWVLGRPLVGETLGDAMVGLLECMYEYRSGGTLDNVADLIRYLNEEGYLCLAGESDHALAVLRLAETFCLKDLYLHALSHCVGMGDLLSDRPDFQRLSLATRTLFHVSERESNLRLKKTSDMLKNFLDHELSESRLGLPPGIRVHLERFRSFLLSFYSAKLGCYPPLAFDARVYRAMARDFAALYNLLVDEGYGSSEAMPSVAVGGICTLQMIQALDARNGFVPMKHRLPRLPHEEQQIRPARTWCLLPRTKPRNDNGQLNHVSLVQASNWSKDMFDNGLVRAYREFEAQCALHPRKLDKHERVSLVDGRKIRWVLIYAVHQTLQHATQRPPGVPDDPNATQVISLARHVKVPWQEGKLWGGMPRSQTEPVLSRLTEPLKARQLASAGVEKKTDIKPDIDCFALAHRQVVPPRSNSFRQAFSPSDTLRRSIRLLNKASPGPLATTPSVSSLKPAHHAGGDGTNHVHMDDSNAAELATLPTELASWSTFMASDTRLSNVSTALSSTGMEDTLEPTLSSSILSEEALEVPTSSGGQSSITDARWSMRSALDGGYKYAVKVWSACRP